MDSAIYKFFLKHVDQSPELIDRLIVSSFLSFHGLKVSNNMLLKSYIIDKKNKTENGLLIELTNILTESETAFGFEELIELFEYVISPSDKIVNGAVYTPEYIRAYIVEQSISRHAGNIEHIKVFDPACGCGGFLLTLAKFIKENGNNNFAYIFEHQIYGCDLTAYSTSRAILLLSLQALVYGEDSEFTFNFVTENSLTFNFREHWQVINDNNGFDIIAGNPPYVASRNMDAETLRLSQLLEVSSSGHPDLYIPFFQIGIQQLNPNGILGYITVNTFMKSINGRAVRQYFQNQNIDLTIINFGGEQIFDERNTYTCICFIGRTTPGITYFRTNSGALAQIRKKDFRRYNYGDLDNKSGWNLVNSKAMDLFVKKIEKTGKPFESIYKTKNGIATLKNKCYKFVPSHTDTKFHYLKHEGEVYPIEIGICRNIVNANKLRQSADLDTMREKIIFPYKRSEDGLLQIISQEEMHSKFPNTFNYLKTQKPVLAGRDKGKGEKGYEEWYAYGRKQSMDNYNFKLFFPHICERPNFVISEESDLLFYNGIAVVADALEPLLILKKIMESDLFFEYMKATTKDYASGYISMSRNYLKKFGIPELTAQQKKLLLESSDPEDILRKIYNLG